MLFGANNKNEFHPDLLWADSQWSDHATGVGILALKAGKITQKTAANFVAVFTAEGKLLELRKNIGQSFSSVVRFNFVVTFVLVPFFFLKSDRNLEVL